MSHYPNILTPPMETAEFLLFSPMSEGSSNSPPPFKFGSVLGHHPISPPDYSNDGYEADLQILEQPVEKFRFRYKSEMAGTHGSLNGRSSDRSRKQAFPSVRLVNFNKPAIIRCSLYQINRREPHAHRLVKKVGLEETDDPHDIEVGPDIGFTANFINMGIIHTAKKYIVTELSRKYSVLKREDVVREEGVLRSLTVLEQAAIKQKAEAEANHINLNQVCLKFDAFERIGDALVRISRPVYSSIINNLKSALTGELKIVRMDHCTSSCRGGREIFLLVEKVAKKNIKVRFFEIDDDGNEIWSDYGKFSDLDVHHQYAIVFKTPPYKKIDIDKQVRVFIELVRPTDNAKSERKEFTYTPCDIIQVRKRARSSNSSYSNSNFSSKDLPAILPNNSDLIVNSRELHEALENNKIDSEEVQKLLEQLIGIGGTVMEELYINSYVGMDPITMDTPLIRSTAGTGSMVTLSEESVIIRVESEIRSFLQALRSYTSAPRERVQLMLESILNKKQFKLDNDNNVLHCLIMRNTHQELLISLLKLIKKYELSNIANYRNKLGQTALHLAVLKQNKIAIELLIGAKADLTIQDLQGNTALHFAIMKDVSSNILMLLLNSESTRTFVDLKNNEGNTALHLAVKTNNLEATKWLCTSGANIDMASGTNGYTPLHMGVADTHKDIVMFLLEYKCNTSVKDYSDCCPLKLAKVLIDPDRPASVEIYRILEQYMKEEGTFEDLFIKEEDEEEEEGLDSSDMDVDVIDIIKSEPSNVLSDPLQIKYKNLTHLPEECMNKISALLNESGSWATLVKHMNYGHLMHLFISDGNCAKSFLDFIMAKGVNLLKIRQVLQELEETEVLEILDNVVKQEP